MILLFQGEWKERWILCHHTSIVFPFLFNNFPYLIAIAAIAFCFAASLQKTLGRSQAVHFSKSLTKQNVLKLLRTGDLYQNLLQSNLLHQWCDLHFFHLHPALQELLILCITWTCSNTYWSIRLKKKTKAGSRWWDSIHLLHCPLF